MIVTYTLDENKNPVPCADVLKWSEWFCSTDKVVKQTKVSDIFISTIFLGIFYPRLNGSVELFETMVFQGELTSDYCVRYENYKQAIIGHRNVVRSFIKKIRNKSTLNIDDIKHMAMEDE